MCNAWCTATLRDLYKICTVSEMKRSECLLFLFRLRCVGGPDYGDFGASYGAELLAPHQPEGNARCLERESPSHAFDLKYRDLLFTLNTCPI